MNWSWKLGRLAGIGVYMHWTFLLLLAWIVFISLGGGAGLWGTVESLAFILLVFVCVVLHELGHALAARRFKIQTRDITLLPIGGLARLERMPDDPRQELWVALAGPAVTLAIAVALGGILVAWRGAAALVPQAMLGGSFLASLFWVNVILLVFNLLPAFPMDGGRVLRALLAHRISYGRATEIASTLGQVMAILFGVVGLLVFNPLLLFIAFFVYLGAASEAQAVQVKLITEGVPVRDAMMTRFRTLSPNDSLGTAADELLSGAQQDFPIVDGPVFRGMLRRETLVQGLREGGRDQLVGQAMSPGVDTADDHEMLDRVLARMRERGFNSLPVLHEEQLVGLLSLQNIGELMMIRSALRRQDVPQPAEELITAS